MGLISFLIDGIFPKLCCHCGKIGTFLCPNCYNQLEFSDEVSVVENLILIQSCTAFGDVSSSIIHTLKYKSVRELANICAEIMYVSCCISEVELITSVPLHPSRQNERGFNQAEEIAKVLSRLLKIPYLPLLRRTKKTANFASITDKSLRAELSKNLFQLRDKNSTFIKNKSVLILDDVWTSGATLVAIASILKDAETSRISAITFSHGK